MSTEPTVPIDRK